MYQERFYRAKIKAGYDYEVTYKESDLLISTDRRIDKDYIKSILKEQYSHIETYIKKNPLFFKSLSPIANDEGAPLIVKDMISSCQAAGVGPFASVAGAVAQHIGEKILSLCGEVIIENGGDIFLKINNEKVIGVYLGRDSPLQWLNLKIKPKDTFFGVASSSSVFGHSTNFGSADLVTVVARDAVLADGFATALSNRVKTENDCNGVISFARDSEFIEGIVIFFEGKIFAWGNLELTD